MVSEEEATLCSLAGMVSHAGLRHGRLRYKSLALSVRIPS